jgi:hypothetical protein
MLLLLRSLGLHQMLLLLQLPHLQQPSQQLSWLLPALLLCWQ